MNTAHYHLLTDEEIERVARDNPDPLVIELLNRLKELWDLEPDAIECPVCGAGC